MVTASPLAMPSAIRPLAAETTRSWNSPVVTFCQRPGPIFLAAITVSAPVRARRSVSRE